MKTQQNGDVFRIFDKIKKSNVLTEEELGQLARIIEIGRVCEQIRPHLHAVVRHHDEATFEASSDLRALRAGDRDLGQLAVPLNGSNHEGSKEPRTRD